MHDSTEKMLMFLNGTAMSGLADHVHVVGSRFLGPCRTAASYRFYAVRDEYPGLVEDGEHGASILGELYEIDRATWQERLLPNEPTELVPGIVVLEDGAEANVMLLELSRVPPGDKVVDIADFGSWRAYLAHLAEQGSS